MSEKTPIGGDRSEAVYFKADGTVTADAQEATSAKITEYAQGVPVRRTYLTRDAATVPQWTDPGGAVAEPDAYDTTKDTWDVTYMDDDGVVWLVETLDALLDVLGAANEPVAAQRKAVAAFQKLPAWKAAPDRLRSEVVAWAAASR